MSGDAKTLRRTVVLSCLLSPLEMGSVLVNKEGGERRGVCLRFSNNEDSYLCQGSLSGSTGCGTRSRPSSLVRRYLVAGRPDCSLAGALWPLAPAVLPQPCRKLRLGRGPRLFMHIPASN